MLQPTKDELLRRKERFTQHLNTVDESRATLRKGQPLEVCNDKSRLQLSRMLSDPKIAQVLDAPAPPPRRTVALLNNSSDAVFQVLSKVKVMGRSIDLEKDYLRLTAPPHPDNIRPPHILEQSFALVKKKFESGERDYVYANSQLKSIRQDLMVQRVETQLTVDVYEYHARVALAITDYGELQQALTRLQYLYSATPYTANQEEFLGYHVLFDSLPSKRQSQSDTVRRLTRAERSLPRVAFAIAVRKALRTENSYQFFRLYHTSTLLERVLMDDMLVNVRVHALHCALLAYRPSVSLAALAVVTGFVNPLRAAGASTSRVAASCSSTSSSSSSSSASSPAVVADSEEEEDEDESSNNASDTESAEDIAARAREEAAARLRGEVACADYLLAHGGVWTAETLALAQHTFIRCHQHAKDKAVVHVSHVAQHHVIGLAEGYEEDFASKIHVDGKLSLAGFTEWQRRHNDALLAAQASTLLDDADLPARNARNSVSPGAEVGAWVRSIIATAPVSEHKSAKRKLSTSDYDSGRDTKREKTDYRKSSSKKPSSKSESSSKSSSSKSSSSKSSSSKSSSSKSSSSKSSSSKSSSKSSSSKSSSSRSSRASSPSRSHSSSSRSRDSTSKSSKEKKEKKEKKSTK